MARSLTFFTTVLSHLFEVGFENRYELNCCFFSLYCITERLTLLRSKNKHVETLFHPVYELSNDFEKNACLLVRACTYLDTL